MQSLFLFYSIPEMEKHILRKRPKYVIFNKKELANFSHGLEMKI